MNRRPAPRLWWLSLLALWTACGPNQPPQYVARVGDKEISLAEFETRLQRLQRSSFHQVDTLDQTARMKVLDDMIARELLIIEALARGLERDSTIAEEMERVEQRSLIDTLYARQARQPEYTFTEDELQRFFKAKEYDVEVRSEQIVCATEAQAGEALRALQAGATFASLVPQYSLKRIQDRFGADGDIGWFKMGEMLDTLKEPMRGMQAGELYPRPVRSSLGYHAFRLTGRRSMPLDSVRAWVQDQLRLERIGQDRARYVEELRRRYTLETHSQEIAALLALPADQKYWEGEDQPLFTWQGGQLTIRDYLTMHRRGRVKHPASLDSAGLHKLADNLAGQQIMKTEARRLGYDQDHAIRASVEQKRNELMVGELFRQEGKANAATVSDAEVRAYYDQNLDRFTNRDGKATDFSRVSDSIRQLLRRTAENQAMDRFIASLRTKYQDRIDIRPEILAKASAAGGEQVSGDSR